MSNKITKGQLTDFFISKGLKATTARVYSLRIFRTYPYAAGDINRVYNSIPKDPSIWITKDLIKKLMTAKEDRGWSNHHLKNTISALIAYLKYNGLQDSDVYEYAGIKRDTLQDRYEKDALTGKWSVKEQSKLVSPDELVKIYDELFEEFTDITKFKAPLPSIIRFRDITIALIYLFPFKEPESNFGVMRNDVATLHLAESKYNRLKVSNLPRDENLFVMTSYRSKHNSYFVIFDSKINSRDEEPIKIELPYYLSKLLGQYVKTSRIKEGEPLFPYITKAKVGAILRKITGAYGHSIGTQMLRKIYVTMRFGEINNDEKEVANSMMHTTETQKKYYTKSGNKVILTDHEAENPNKNKRRNRKAEPKKPKDKVTIVKE